MAFDIGDKVKHKVFGEGTVVDIAEGDMNKLTIAFKDGKKVILSLICKTAEIIENCYKPSHRIPLWRYSKSSIYIHWNVCPIWCGYILLLEVEEEEK